MTYLTDAPDNFSTWRRYSTLDLIQPNCLTLLTASSSDADQLACVVRKKVESLGGVMAHRSMGRDFELSENVDSAASQAWLSCSGLSDNCGLLVRPDQHILGRIRQGSGIEDAACLMRLYNGAKDGLDDLLP